MTPTTITTVSGRHIDLLHPQPDTIELVDVAHHLAHISRFTGAVTHSWSVAQHSMLVMRLLQFTLRAPVMAQMAGLMHDAHEFACGDVSTPMKHTLQAVAPGAWRHIEAGLERAMRTRFCLHTAAGVFAIDIKRADMLALAAERRVLQPADATPWSCLVGVPVERDALDFIGMNAGHIHTPAYWANQFKLAHARLQRELDNTATTVLSAARQRHQDEGYCND